MFTLIKRFFIGFIEGVQKSRRLAADAYLLSQMTPRQLEDIGITRSDIPRIFDKKAA